MVMPDSIVLGGVGDPWEASLPVVVDGTTGRTFWSIKNRLMEGDSIVLFMLFQAVGVLYRAQDCHRLDLVQATTLPSLIQVKLQCQTQCLAPLSRALVFLILSLSPPLSLQHTYLFHSLLDRVHPGWR